jgi:galactoside O-acetyltransferase
MLKKIIHHIFYSPYKSIKKDPFAKIGNSKLGKGFSIEYRLPRTKSAFEAGDGCILDHQNIFESCEGFIKVGDNTFINAGTRIISREKISIGNYVLISWGCTIYDHNSHSIDYRDRMEDHVKELNNWGTGKPCHDKNWNSVVSKEIQIEDHVWLGFDVVVLKGVKIGEGAVIGAKSVVTRDIPAWCIAAGNPAKIVKEIPPEMRKRVSTIDGSKIC